MKITNIKQQTKDKNRVSFFIDEKYSFSLTISQWQDFNLKVGDDLTDDTLKNLKKQSDFGKQYAKALNYLVRRKRSIYEMRQYLSRKGLEDEEINQIIKKLTDLNYLDDRDFAESWVADRNSFKPSSKRKLFAELLKKGINKNIISGVLSSEAVDEQENLKHIIESKRRQERYRNDDKLIAYLCRNGFTYAEVVEALKKSTER